MPPCHLRAVDDLKLMARLTHRRPPFQNQSTDHLSGGTTMPIRVECGNCHKAFAAPDHFAGKVAKCVSCKSPIPVPVLAIEPGRASLLDELAQPIRKSASSQQALAASDRGRKSCPAASSSKGPNRPAATASRQTSDEPPIRAECGNCRKSFAAPGNYAGKLVKCPACGAKISIPSPGSTPSLASLLDDELARATRAASASTSLGGIGPGSQWLSQSRSSGGSFSILKNRVVWAGLIVCAAIAVLAIVVTLVVNDWSNVQVAQRKPTWSDTNSVNQSRTPSGQVVSSTAPPKAFDDFRRMITMSRDRLREHDRIASQIVDERTAKSLALELALCDIELKKEMIAMATFMNGTSAADAQLIEQEALKHPDLMAMQLEIQSLNRRMRTVPPRHLAIIMVQSIPDDLKNQLKTMDVTPISRMKESLGNGPSQGH